jgi:hypothetical protein
MMTLYETLDAINALRSLIFNIWNMFVAVHIAIVGGLLFVNRPISLAERVVAFLAYLGFVFMNGRAQLANYGLLEVLADQARALETQCITAACVHMAIPVLQSKNVFIGLIYGLGAVSTFLIVMLVNVISRKNIGE